MDEHLRGGTEEMVTFVTSVSKSMLLNQCTRGWVWHATALVSGICACMTVRMLLMIWEFSRIQVFVILIPWLLLSAAAVHCH